MKLYTQDTPDLPQKLKRQYEFMIKYKGYLKRESVKIGDLQRYDKL